MPWCKAETSWTSTASTRLARTDEAALIFSQKYRIIRESNALRSAKEV